MKHTDLMLNDLVMYQGKILRVGCISDYDIKIDLFEDGEDTPYAEIWQEELDEVEPIPLTAEILEKNGFEEKTESSPFVYYLFKDGDNSVSLEHTYDTTDKEDYWACCIGNRLCDVCTISMHYVHELQHALRLCGVDKEIVL